MSKGWIKEEKREEGKEGKREITIMRCILGNERKLRIEDVHRLFALGFFFHVSSSSKSMLRMHAAINDAIFFSLFFPLIFFEIL